MISDISFKSERSKKADRSIYLDNLVVREYETDSSDTDETAFPKFKSGTYTKDGSTMNTDIIFLKIMTVQYRIR